MRYSPSVGCFYPSDSNYSEALPSDVIDVPHEDFELAMNRGINQRIVLSAGNRIQLEEIEVNHKAEKWVQIKAERDSRSSGGFKVEISPGIFKWYHSDQTSRIQHLALLMAGANVPAIPWKTMDGSFTPMTQSIAAAIFQAALNLDKKLFEVAEQHKAYMEASSDPASYDYSINWPERYIDEV